ncbi:ATP-binding protein [Candidatus Magnetobacterium casense]|uniref:ATP-binding protein n=1 Tax=Candidatus Magnetobacterium casense TaxID=1455061 RepID=A0ABS6RXX4_9BACT|nr:ATP-binding protein [Candidatus Magnetobacterium casensis]MBV6341490.1 ATP-binding protein [Candidatus Magnetobacterium casensis]
MMKEHPATDTLMKERVLLRIPSHPMYLCVVRAVAVLTAELCGLRNQDVEDVRHAVDEACSNVIRHAYKGDTQRQIVIGFRCLSDSADDSKVDAFEVTIEDDGAKTRPQDLTQRSLDEVRAGGLGLHIINKAFGSVTYDENKQEGNRLILVRTIRRNP